MILARQSNAREAKYEVSLLLEEFRIDLEKGESRLRADPRINDPELKTTSISLDSSDDEEDSDNDENEDTEIKG